MVLGPVGVTSVFRPANEFGTRNNPLSKNELAKNRQVTLDCPDDRVEVLLAVADKLAPPLSNDKRNG